MKNPLNVCLYLISALYFGTESRVLEHHQENGLLKANFSHMKSIVKPLRA